MPVILKNIFIKHIFNFIKSQPLSVCQVNILYDKWEVGMKYLSCKTRKQQSGGCEGLGWKSGEVGEGGQRIQTSVIR